MSYPLEEKYHMLLDDVQYLRNKCESMEDQARDMRESGTEDPLTSRGMEDTSRQLKEELEKIMTNHRLRS